jgi:hypothetical protein
VLALAEPERVIDHAPRRGEQAVERSAALHPEIGVRGGHAAAPQLPAPRTLGIAAQRHEAAGDGTGAVET